MTLTYRKLLYVLTTLVMAYHMNGMPLKCRPWPRANLQCPDLLRPMQRVTYALFIYFVEDLYR